MPKLYARRLNQHVEAEKLSNGDYSVVGCELPVPGPVFDFMYVGVEEKAEQLDSGKHTLEPLEEFEVESPEPDFEEYLKSVNRISFANQILKGNGRINGREFRRFGGQGDVEEISQWLGSYYAGYRYSPDFKCLKVKNYENPQIIMPAYIGDYIVKLEPAFETEQMKFIIMTDQEFGDWLKGAQWR